MKLECDEALSNFAFKFNLCRYTEEPAVEGGFWGAADVRDAASLTPEAFKRDYMLAGKPVIIRGEPGAVALAAALTLDTLLTMCGDLSPDLGNRIVAVLQHGQGPAIPAITLLAHKRTLTRYHTACPSVHLTRLAQSDPDVTLVGGPSARDPAAAAGGHQPAPSAHRRRGLKHHNLTVCS